jgi:hypothetical protein
MRKLSFVSVVICMLAYNCASPALASKQRKVTVTYGAKAGIVSVGVAKKPVVTKVIGLPGRPGKPGVSCGITEDQTIAPALSQQRRTDADGSRWGPATRTCTDGEVQAGIYCLANCPVNPATGFVIFRQPTPDDARELPPKILPIPRLSPPLDKVENSNIGGYLVGMPTYFGVDEDNWTTPLEATAEEGQYKMHVVAKPLRLEVQVDGELVRTCTGNQPVDYVGNNWQTTANDCKHVFTDTTDGTANVSLQIIYEHTYRSEPPGAPAPAGELGASQVNNFDIPLAEVQPVIKSVS